jgi:rRNA maturation protein Rpf1
MGEGVVSCHYPAREFRDWKELLKVALLHDEHTSVAELQEILLDYGFDPTPSTFTISGIRMAFRHDLKVLRKRGVLGEIDRTKLEPIKRKPCKPVREPKPFYYRE